MTAPKYKTKQFALFCGDHCQVLETALPPESIDLTVTSPPYDDLRKYNGYRFDVSGLAKSLYRVTKDGGVVVWIVNDQTIDGSESLTSFYHAQAFKDTGFRAHDTMIWLKNSGIPQRNRYIQAFEYMFIFSKGPPKTFLPLKDKPNKLVGVSSFGVPSRRKPDGTLEQYEPTTTTEEFGIRLNVWESKTAAQEHPCKKNVHPAQFPVSLVKDHILSWSRPGEIVLDPCSGAASTGVAALQTSRLYIGIDCSEEYIDLSYQRLQSLSV